MAERKPIDIFDHETGQTISVIPGPNGELPSEEEISQLLHATPTAPPDQPADWGFQNPIPSPADLLQKLTPSGATIGGMVGGTVGSMVPYVGYPAGVLGAGAGAFAGALPEAAGNYLNAKVTGKPLTLKEALLDYPVDQAKAAMVGQAVGAPLGAIAGKAGGKLWQAIKGDLPPAAEAMKTAATTLHPDLKLSPTQLTGNPLTAGAESVATYGLVAGKPKPQDFYDAQPPAIEAGMRKMAGDFGPDVDAEFAGTMFKEGMQQKATAAKAKYQPLFQQAEEAAGGHATPYPIANFEAAKDQVAAEASGLGKLKTSVQSMVRSLLPVSAERQATVDAAGKMVAGVKPPPWGGSPVATQRQVLADLGFDADIIDVVTKGAPLTGEASFPAMRQVRTALQDIVKKETRTGGVGMTPKGRQATILLKGITADIAEVRAANEAVDQPLQKAIDTFKAEYAHPLLNPKSIQNLRRTVDSANPERAVGQFFGSKKSVRNLQELQVAVGPDAYKIGASAELHRILDAASDNTGTFSVQRFLTQAQPLIQRQEYLKQWLGPDIAKRFTDTVKFLETLKKNSDLIRNPSQSGRVVTGMAQFGAGTAAATSLLTGNVPGAIASGTIALTPTIIARMMYSPTVGEAMAKLTAKAAPSLGAKETARFLAMLGAMQFAPTPWEAHQQGAP